MQKSTSSKSVIIDLKPTCNGVGVQSVREVGVLKKIIEGLLIIHYSTD